MKLLSKITSPEDLRNLAPEHLPQLAAEIREEIISTVSKNGGHLGSSLCATDLILALHYVFNTPHDRLVFDTGHQAYAHKLITGRYSKFGTLRKKGGLSGFLKRDESEYDAFGAGHASTALSAALGMAAARDIKGEKRKIVAVVADGSLTGGMAYEALQNAGQMGTDILVVLNDNQMFISDRVGALGEFLTKLILRDSFQKTGQKIKHFLRRYEFYGRTLLRIAKRTRVLVFPGMLFEEMGFAYFGPVDGHNVEKLAEVLKCVKEINGPVFLHVLTKKGKGYEPAEEHPITFHGLGIFDKVTGHPAETKQPPSYTKVFSSSLLRLAAQDKRITAITAAMPEGTGLDQFRDTYPSRYYDVGIAEEHAATFAAGQACEGLRPVLAVYSSFAQRCYDQILHDICLQKLPVVLALDRAGVVGEDGPTHHGVFDISYLRHMPNMTIIAPADENELQHALKTALSINGPCAIRYPRGAGTGAQLDDEMVRLPVGKGIWLKRGSDLTIIAAGNRVRPALDAAETLRTEGISCGVINIRFIKPLDGAIIDEALAVSPKIITVEDNVLAGGFGSAVEEYVAGTGVKFSIIRIGIPDKFVAHAKPAELYRDLGMDAEGIAGTARKFVKDKIKP